MAGTVRAPSGDSAPAGRAGPSNRRSFRPGWRLFALVVGVTLLLAAVGAFLVVRNDAVRRDRSVDAAVAAGEAASRATDRVLVDSAGLLGLLARSPAIGSATPEQVQAVLDAVDTATAGFTGGLAWIDDDGTLLAGKGPTAGSLGSDHSDQPAVRAVLEEGDEVFVGSAYRLDGLTHPVVPVAVPIRAAGGDVAGVVVGALDVDRLARYLAGFRAGGSNIMVVDRSGQVVVSDSGPGDLARTGDDPVVTRLRAGADSVVGATDPAGRTERLVTGAVTDTGRWLVVTSRPTEDVFGSDAATMQLELVAVAVAALVALGLGWVGSRRLHAALERADAAEASEQAKRDRVASLRLATADLAGAGSRHEAARSAVAGATVALGAGAASVALRSDSDPGVVEVVAADGFPTDLVDQYQRRTLDDRTPAVRAIDQGRPLYLDRAALTAEFPEVAPTLIDSGHRSWAAVPLWVDRQVRGAIGMAFEDETATDPDCQMEMERFAGHVGDAMARAHTREVEHEFALALQRNLLPDVLPDRPDLLVHAEYLPANDILDVGGDWYDVVERSDGGTMVVVGDVVGHGVPAIAAMGQLSSVCRAVAEEAGPARLMAYLERSAASVRHAAGTTAVCVLIDADRRRARYAIAGHPRPMLFQDGQVVELTESASLPLAYADVERQEAEVPLSLPATLVLFSDGLLERRDASYAQRAAELADILRSTPVDDLSHAIITRLLGGDESRDDTVVVVVHLPA